jgi:hypothetical protein
VCSRTDKAGERWSLSRSRNGLAAMGPFGRHSRASPEFTDGSEIGSQKASAAFVARAQIRIVLTVPGLPHQDWRGGEKCGSSVVCRQGAPATFRKGSTETAFGRFDVPKRFASAKDEVAWIMLRYCGATLEGSPEICRRSLASDALARAAAHGRGSTTRASRSAQAAPLRIPRCYAKRPGNSRYRAEK